MSYQVLARKWRPASFKEVVGQDHVVKALSNSLTQDKLHHAYLLTGTRGVGKTSIARILTKCLNCETGLTDSPCDECSTCLSIAQGTSMDFQEVDAASRRGVEEMQSLLETVVHMPGSSRYKIYLIDEVHMLTKHSFNALLKTLEEPPPHIIFILATTEPESVPATVLSRCLQFHLKNLAPQLLVQQIEHILTEENIDFDAGSVALIARAGRGSLRDALTLLDQAIAYADNVLTSQKISEMLGILPYDEVYRLLNFIISGKSDLLFQKLQEISEFSIDYHRLLDLILESIQFISIAQIEEDALVNAPVNKEEIIKLSSEISQEDAQVLYQIGIMAKRDLDLAPDLASGFEMALIRMMLFLPTLDKDPEGEIKAEVEDVASLEKLRNSETIIAGNEVHGSQAKKAKDQINKLDPSDEDNTKVEETQNHSNISSSIPLDKNSWNEVFLSLELPAGTRQLISHCSFVKKEDSIIYFSMPEDKLNLLSGSHRKDFQESLSKALNQTVNLFYEPASKKTDSPNAIKEKDALKKKQDLEDSIKNDPKVKLMIDELGASVLDSSIKEIK
ncbi:MAG: DNA polymerase III subunit gamma/tau [SAR86 cluster bacterium]|jgi:DNA polymerase III subunit gamma/tau|nr:DNA polymerase III subunit gamma/tau [SAR86 cluster bacterium]